jgi:hypothetical protein
MFTQPELANIIEFHRDYDSCWILYSTNAGELNIIKTTKWCYWRYNFDNANAIVQICFDTLKKIYEFINTGSVWCHAKHYLRDSCNDADASWRVDKILKSSFVAILSSSFQKPGLLATTLICWLPQFRYCRTGPKQICDIRKGWWYDIILSYLT